MVVVVVVVAVVPRMAPGPRSVPGRRPQVRTVCGTAGGARHNGHRVYRRRVPTHQSRGRLDVVVGPIVVVVVVVVVALGSVGGVVVLGTPVEGL